MILRLFHTTIQRYFREANLPLLCFLVMILDVKLVVKLLGILLALLWLRKSLRISELLSVGVTRFYMVMVGLAAFNLLLNLHNARSGPGFFAFGLGCLYWSVSIASAWIILTFLRTSSGQKLEKTIDLLFVLHILCMYGSLLIVCIRSGSFNPYIYQGDHQKYFINTGDYIRGIGFDSSVAAAMISAAGLLFFLYRGKWAKSLLCMGAILMAGSNLINLLVVCILILLFIVHTNRLQKSMILVYIGMLIVFWGKISPENKDYAQAFLSKPTGNVETGSDRAGVVSGGSVLTSLDRGSSAVPVSVGISMNARNPVAAATPATTPPLRDIDFLASPEMINRQNLLHAFRDSLYSPVFQDSLNSRIAAYGKPGRWIAWQEMLDFFKSHPSKLLMGAGMGNFSSRLAFKSTGLDIGGSYPRSMRLIHPAFRDHYLYLYLYYFTRSQGGHSVINLPDSVYGQILGEYGLAGILAFLCIYVLYFLRRVRAPLGLPLILLLGAGFFTEYWFEQLSIVILFELLLQHDWSHSNN